METQNQIKRTLEQPEVIEYICNILDNNDTISRTQLADNLCGHYNFFDPLGNKQRCPFGKPGYLAGIVCAMMWRNSFVAASTQKRLVHCHSLYNSKASSGADERRGRHCFSVVR
jgi:hypothetical protein